LPFAPGLGEQAIYMFSPTPEIGGYNGNDIRHGKVLPFLQP
jgi:hypothetical protein